MKIKNETVLLIIGIFEFGLYILHQLMGSDIWATTHLSISGIAIVGYLIVLTIKNKEVFG